MPQSPTTDNSTGEAPEALAAAPNASATGRETPAAAPESPATTTPTSGETMLAGESHEFHHNDGEALFTGPPKKKGKRTYGRLELKPPDMDIPEFGDGPHSKRYPLEFKLNVVEYAHSVVESGKGPGGTVGIGHATRAQIADKATLLIAAWIRNWSTYQKTGSAGGGGVRHKRGEKGHEKVIGGRREAAFSRRGRATNCDLDQRPAFGSRPV